MARVLLILWHVAPLVPAVLGYYYAAIATLGLVCLPYIKIKKFNGQIAIFESMGQNGADYQQDIDSLKVARNRWSKLTFIIPK